PSIGILLSLLGFLPLVTPICPAPCKCTTNITDCSLKNLTVENLPTAFHPSAEIIHLGSNRLTSIPNGLFDNLRSLQVVYLQGNPWECTCDILYLRSWLQWQQNRSQYRDVRCSSPEHLQGAPVLDPSPPTVFQPYFPGLNWLSTELGQYTELGEIEFPSIATDSIKSF
uniref:Glycoprotein Ib platelet subunit beta n=1 Tax=Cyanistes caeruleus TaxID=156563 RepID=A0A8C0V592_CYACU